MSNLSEGEVINTRPYKVDDEISLAELLHHLIMRWKVIVTAMVVTLAAAIGYLVMATPMYSADIAYNRSVGGLNALNAMPGINYSEVQAVNELATRLASYEHFNRYIDESEHGRESLAMYFGDALSEREWDLLQRDFFFDYLSIVRPRGEDDGTSYRLEISYPSDFSGPDFLNDYFEWARKDYRNILVSRAEHAIEDMVGRNRAQMEAHQAAYEKELSSRIAKLSEADAIRLAELHDHMEAEIQSVISSREERIRALQEAEQIAQRLGIETPTTPRELGRHETSRDVIYAEINSQGGLPLYFMGTQALEAEREVVEANLRDRVRTAEILNLEEQISLLQDNRTIEALLARQQHTPFIDDYIELEQQSILLRSNVMTADDIRIVEVSRWAYQPSSADSPRNMLVLALALILGSMLGVILVASQALWTQARAVGLK